MFCFLLWKYSFRLILKLIHDHINLSFIIFKSFSARLKRSFLYVDLLQILDISFHFFSFEADVISYDVIIGCLGIDYLIIEGVSIGARFKNRSAIFVFICIKIGVSIIVVFSWSWLSRNLFPLIFKPLLLTHVAKFREASLL